MYTTYSQDTPMESPLMPQPRTPWFPWLTRQVVMSLGMHWASKVRPRSPGGGRPMRRTMVAWYAWDVKDCKRMIFPHKHNLSMTMLVHTTPLVGVFETL